MESINIFIDKLIEKDNKKYIKKVFKEYELGSLQVQTGYYKDNVNEEKIYTLIRRSIKDIKLRYFIPEILFLIKDESITDLIFEYCLSYKGKFKETLLITLAHKWLKIEQLEILNKELSTPEAFYKLFLIYMYSEEFKLKQLEIFMKLNKEHWKSLLNYKDHFQEKSVSQEKIDFVDSLLN